MNADSQAQQKEIFVLIEKKIETRGDLLDTTWSSKLVIAW